MNDWEQRASLDWRREIDCYAARVLIGTEAFYWDVVRLTDGETLPDALGAAHSLDGAKRAAMRCLAAHLRAEIARHEALLAEIEGESA